MWDASATKEGCIVSDWESKIIPDPTLDAAFDSANKKLQKLGFDSPNLLRLGWIANGECRTMLSYGTKRPVFNRSEDGVMTWTDNEVQEINKASNWNFPLSAVLEAYEDPTSDFYVGAFHTVRLFWETCVEYHLGIYFSF